jgi:hypothetical protein
MPGLKPAKFKPVPLQRRMSWRHKRFMDFTRAHHQKRVGDILLGEAGFYFHVVINGPDLVVRGVIATWFGGAHDPQDNGETASGVNTKKSPDVVGCALPMHGFGLAATEGSPLPRIPWFTKVRVQTAHGKRIELPLIDLGPARFTNHGIDLTPVAFQKLGGDLKQGLLSVDYVVLGGTAFI